MQIIDAAPGVSSFFWHFSFLYRVKWAGVSSIQRMLFLLLCGAYRPFQRKTVTTLSARVESKTHIYLALEREAPRKEADRLDRLANSVHLDSMQDTDGRHLIIGAVLVNGVAKDQVPRAQQSMDHVGVKDDAPVPRVHNVKYLERHEELLPHARKDGQIAFRARIQEPTDPRRLLLRQGAPLRQAIDVQRLLHRGLRRRLSEFRHRRAFL